MNPFEVNAEPRSGQGKGASRRLRRSGVVPGIVYGAGQASQSIQVDHHQLSRRLTNEGFYSHILTLNLGGEAQRVVLKDLQRHPWKPQVMHFDLQRVSETEKLRMRIPVHFVNEGACIGVKHEGGVISHLMTEVEVECLPKDLPEFIALDLADVHVGHTIHIGDLKMPEGVVVAALLHGGDPSQPVVSVHIPRVVEEVEPGAAAAATPEAAAPAAAEAAKEPEKTKEKKG